MRLRNTEIGRVIAESMLAIWAEITLFGEVRSRAINPCRMFDSTDHDELRAVFLSEMLVISGSMLHKVAASDYQSEVCVRRHASGTATCINLHGPDWHRRSKSGPSVKGKGGPFGSPEMCLFTFGRVETESLTPLMREGARRVGLTELRHINYGDKGMELRLLA